MSTFFAKSLATATFATAMLSMGMSAQAADPLHNTKWQTIDDKTGKPKGIIKVTEEKGKLVGRLVKSYTYGKGKPCKLCKGKYANKPLDGAPIFWNLKPTGKNQYTGGTIFDPRKGKSYKLKGELINGGKKLKLRGYIGSPMLGRTQTWKRLK